MFSPMRNWTVVRPNTLNIKFLFSSIGIHNCKVSFYQVSTTDTYLPNCLVDGWHEELVAI